jgi:DNA-binding beta-propeller fold protein YncE
MRPLVSGCLVTFVTLTLGIATSQVPGARAAPTVGGSQLWVSRYDSPHHGTDRAGAIAASPDGSIVAVTGTTNNDFGTTVYDAATGSSLWFKRYNGGSADTAAGVAVSPDSLTVFVTGTVDVSPTNPADYTTIAYDSATGTPKWLTAYNGPGGGRDFPSALAVSPDGSKVFVTGQSTGTTSGYDYATLAYNSGTGAQLWETRYTSLSNAEDSANALAVSPDGTTVFVTGSTTTPAGDTDYTTVAYDASSGAQKWTKSFGSAFGSDDTATSVGVRPDGSMVYVIGYIFGSPDFANYVTLAYDAATGGAVWQKRYRGPVSSDFAQSLAVSPDGSRVFVTGYSEGSTTSDDYATVAYDAATGAVRWGRRYNGPGNDLDQAFSVGVSPDGSKVFVTGSSYGTSVVEYATVAYDATAGSQLWVSRYQGPSGSSYGQALVVSPDGAKVYVTGYSQGTAPGDDDYATLAYEA